MIIDDSHSANQRRRCISVIPIPCSHSTTTAAYSDLFYFLTWAKENQVSPELHWLDLLWCGLLPLHHIQVVLMHHHVISVWSSSPSSLPCLSCIAFVKEKWIKCGQTSSISLAPHHHHDHCPSRCASLQHCTAPPPPPRVSSLFLWNSRNVESSSPSPSHAGWPNVNEWREGSYTCRGGQVVRCIFSLPNSLASHYVTLRNY